MKAWIYIIIAAIFQTLWGITLKILDFKIILHFIRTYQIFCLDFVVALIPLICYFVIGFIIVFFISKAYKMLPMSIVYAYWMALTLVFQTLIDILYFQEHFEWFQYCFLSLILIGVIGLKLSTNNPDSKELILKKIHEIEEDSSENVL